MMDKRQIEKNYKSQWKCVEVTYQWMVGRARKARDTAGLAWAKAWRLVQLRSVCQNKQAHLEQLSRIEGKNKCQ